MWAGASRRFKATMRGARGCGANVGGERRFTAAAASAWSRVRRHGVWAVDGAVREWQRRFKSAPCGAAGGDAVRVRGRFESALCGATGGGAVHVRRW